MKHFAIGQRIETVKIHHLSGKNFTETVWKCSTFFSASQPAVVNLLNKFKATGSNIHQSRFVIFLKNLTCQEAPYNDFDWQDSIDTSFEASNYAHRRALYSAASTSRLRFLKKSSLAMIFTINLTDRSTNNINTVHSFTPEIVVCLLACLSLKWTYRKIFDRVRSQDVGG